MKLSAMRTRWAAMLSLLGFFAEILPARCAGVNSLLAPCTSFPHGNPHSVRAGPLMCAATYGSVMRLRGGGVPKFYGWLSERYPLINQDAKNELAMPEIDNLYLDMNGIIHPCTHGNSEELVDLTVDTMFRKIFAFLDQLMQLVRPQQLLFMAIDGVAPRAKYCETEST